jgi:hypothetical protein
MVSYCDSPAYLLIISGNKLLTASLRSENTRNNLHIVGVEDLELVN